VIAGWDQGGYEAQINALIASLNLSARIKLIGPVYGDDKLSIFKRADAFVLPSKSEGMPMAILEAWSHSLPVLMTRYCNLQTGFEKRAALETGVTKEEIAAGLEQLFAMSASDLRAMGMRGRNLVETHYSWPQVAAQMEQVYHWVLNGGNVPECVHL
jgi:glycosyltransferase involved in cell wall biosynthesis